MAGNDTPRDAASAALIELRKAMGMTQQEFAVKVLKCAVPTIGRYETTTPPRGDVLLKLSQIAKQNKQFQLSDTFLGLFLDESFRQVHTGLTIAGGAGYLRLKLKTAKEVEAAMQFMRDIEVLRGQREPGYIHPVEQQIGGAMGASLERGKQK